MPLLNTAQFTLSGMGAKRSLGDRLRNRFYSVKEFGATGDGTTDDTAAIIATFEDAWGTSAAPHGNPDHWGGGSGGDWGTTVYANPVVLFPPGDYMVSQTLQTHLAFGASIIGAGSHQTRIFWNPEAPEHYPADSVDLPNQGIEAPGTPMSAVLECRMSWHFHMEGITIDGSGVQQHCIRAMTYPPNVAIVGDDDGSAGCYKDVHLTNALNSGFVTWGEAMGSERTWILCRFTNCQIGHQLLQYNALNHCFYNCLFEGNVVGARTASGGCLTFWACEFNDNETFDIDQGLGMSRIAGCDSTSKNFIHAAGAVYGCTHDHGSPGYFWTPTYFHSGAHTALCPLPGAALIGGVNVACLSAKGNRSTNGIFYTPTNTTNSFIHLVGNEFDDPDYLDTYVDDVRVDGVAM